MTKSLLFLTFTTAALAADIDQALSLGKRTENRMFRDSLKATWLPGGKAFWYRVQTGAKAYEFVLVQADTGERRAAASLKELGLPTIETKTSATKIELRPTQRTGESFQLNIVNEMAADVELFWINTDGEHKRYGAIKAGDARELHTYDGHMWLMTSPAGEHLAVVEASVSSPTIVIDGKGVSKPAAPAKNREEGGISPDGKWLAFVEKGRVMLRQRKSGGTRPLKTGLDEQSPFHGACVWAPDSSAFVVSSAVNVPKRRVGVVESTPKGQLQPRLKEFDYVKPGDALPQPFPVIFRLTADSYEWTRVKTDLFANAFTETDRLDMRWAPHSREFYFNHNRRGHQLYRILAVDGKSGAVRVVVVETSQTFIDHSKKTWRHWLDGSGELLWMSERDGWCHLWLYDVAKGGVKNQVTSGAWPVREVLRVDEERREVWFLASGLKKEEDPYHLHLCRVKLDGSGFHQLTAGDGNHQVEFSPSREFFIDSWSRADHAPVHELHRSSDGGLVCVLEKADASALLAAGWTMPERFVAKGRDGTTDIHGILIKPSHFDPAKKYPVVEQVYAGPHSAFVPKEFGRLLRQHELAELGFIVVQADGMGTNHRGKVFHDVCWKNLKDAGFPDRIAWIKAAAQTRPWMDLDRVGIYGGSAGGQNAMRALLDHNDFYQVAVADCGCHDNRMDKIWWNEQWMGWPVDESYARSSNLEDAHKLQGRLLLIVGEVDTNVDPASTTQVVGALQKAGKTFDYMPMIGIGHGAAETPYGSRLRMEFLVRHLGGGQ